MLSANFKPKRTVAASRGFLATARLSCIQFRSAHICQLKLTSNYTIQMPTQRIKGEPVHKIERPWLLAPDPLCCRYICLSVFQITSYLRFWQCKVPRSVIRIGSPKRLPFLRYYAAVVGHITRLNRPSVCPSLPYGLVTRKQKV